MSKEKIKKLKKRILKDNEVIHYRWLTNNLGRAEFDICPFFKYGKLKKVLIYPRQQENVEYYYEIKCCNQNNFSLRSWIHEGTESPWAWRYFYCKEHKQLEVSVYVPRNTNTIAFSQDSCFDIIFTKKEGK